MSLAQQHCALCLRSAAEVEFLFRGMAGTVCAPCVEAAAREVRFLRAEAVVRRSMQPAPQGAA